MYQTLFQQVAIILENVQAFKKVALTILFDVYNEILSFKSYTNV